MKTKLLLTLAVLFMWIVVQAAEDDVVCGPEYPHIVEYANQMDSLENANRGIFTFNSYVDDYFLMPLAVTWASIIPEYGIKGIHRVFNNFYYPKRFANAILQGDWNTSGSESLRFAINSTVGLLGFYDPAKDWFDIHPREKDFGQTLAKWGVNEGSYVVMPFGGGNNMRDGFGSAVDVLFNPLTYFSFGYAPLAANGVNAANANADFHHEVELLSKNSADAYGMQKVYFYLRRYLVTNELDDYEKNFTAIKKVYGEELKKVPQTVGKVHADTDLANVRIPDYKGQSPEIDSFRYNKLVVYEEDESIWDDMSLWNNEFKNRRKTTEVSIVDDERNRKLPYAYWRQDEEMAPVAYVIPRANGGVFNHELDGFAKLLFDQGYSVVIIPNVFSWQFIAAAAGDWLPGYMPEDVRMLDSVIQLVEEDFCEKEGLVPEHRILTGISLGGMQVLKLAELDQKRSASIYKRYAAVNPPVDMVHAMRVLDGYSDIWSNFEVSEQLMITSMLLVKHHMFIAGLRAAYSDKSKGDKAPQGIAKIKKMYGGEMPFVQSEARALFSLKAKQSTIEMLYTLYKYDKSLLHLNLLEPNNNKELYTAIVGFSYEDYANKVLIPFFRKKYGPNFGVYNLKVSANLEKQERLLRENGNVFVLHTVDDMFVSREHKEWLKENMGTRCLMFDHGGHLGEMYTEKFRYMFIAHVLRDIR